MSQVVRLMANSVISERRPHARGRVFRSALLYPVLREAPLSILDVSQMGFCGECALPLSLAQQVHISLDEQIFVTAEVRWLIGARCGLETEDPVSLAAKQASAAVPSDGNRRAAPRSPVNLAATLVTCAPVFTGVVRHVSAEEMMIEAIGIPEGTRLLVKARGYDFRMGRVRWSRSDMVGIAFEPAAAPARGKNGE